MSTGAQDALAIFVAVSLAVGWLWIILRKPSPCPWMQEHRKQTRQDDEPWTGPCDKE